MGWSIPSAKKSLTVLSLIVCIFFGALKSSEIIDSIEHSGRGVGHSHSVISLASIDFDHDVHEPPSQHSIDDHHAPGDEPSKPDLAHHHHHNDLGADVINLGGTAAAAFAAYPMTGLPATRDFRAFGPAEGLKRPPRTTSQHV